MIDFLKSKFTIKRSLGFLAVVASLLWLSIFSFPDQKLHLVFCDVGQGDATLVSKGFDQILIDGGPNDKVLQCLAENMPFFDRTIEMVVLTHPEADHLTGLISVLDKYKVNYFLSGPEGSNSAVYTALVKKLADFCKASPCRLARRRLMNVYTGERIKLGDIELETWWPERGWVAERVEGGGGRWEVGNNTPSLLTPDSQLTSYPYPTILGAKTTHTKLNDFSLVFLFKYKDFKALLMADADSKIQDEIAEVNSLTEIDILKFPHHGSKTGMLESFLEKIQPKEAVVSVGKNSYGHPTKEALELLTKYGIKIRRTDLEGEIKYEF